MKGNGDSERIRISDANLVDIKVQKHIIKLTILKKAKFRLVIELNTTITYIYRDINAIKTNPPHNAYE
jgi:hypothetical protein